jgi:hypothetical protein
MEADSVEEKIRQIPDFTHDCNVKEQNTSYNITIANHFIVNNNNIRFTSSE